jgi:agmatinase
MKLSSAVLSFAAAVAAHGNDDNQEPIVGPQQGLWYNTLPGDGGTQVGGVPYIRVPALT